MVQKAIDLNPHHPDWFALPFVHNLNRLGRYEEALKLLATIRRGGFCGRYLAEIVSLNGLGREAEAKIISAKLLAVFPAFPTKGADVLSMWNFEPSMLQQFRSNLIKTGLSLRDANLRWRSQNSS